MKRVIGIVTACAVASFVPIATFAQPSATKPATHAPATVSLEARQAAHLAELRNLAPADEYFGRLKMSILGIKNTIRDLGARYAVNHDIADRTVITAADTEGAIRDWERKYPHDKDVARSMYYLQRLYTTVACESGKAKAHMVAMWLFADYPKSPQAKLLKKQLAMEASAPAAVTTVSQSSGAAAATPSYASVFGGAYTSEFSH
jgi:hypothetical protein